MLFHRRDRTSTTIQLSHGRRIQGFFLSLSLSKPTLTGSLCLFLALTRCKCTISMFFTNRPAWEAVKLVLLLLIQMLINHIFFSSSSDLVKRVLSIGFQPSAVRKQAVISSVVEKVKRHKLDTDSVEAKSKYCGLSTLWKQLCLS